MLTRKPCAIGVACLWTFDLPLMRAAILPVQCTTGCRCAPSALSGMSRIHPAKLDDSKAIVVNIAESSQAIAATMTTHLVSRAVNNVSTADTEDPALIRAIYVDARAANHRTWASNDSASSRSVSPESLTVTLAAGTVASTTARVGNQEGSSRYRRRKPGRMLQS